MAITEGVLRHGKVGSPMIDHIKANYKGGYCKAVLDPQGGATQMLRSSWAGST